MNVQDIYSKLEDGSLKVRYHTGVGFMQAYLTEDVRLHVWHPQLPPELEAFGCRHDHRFDLESHVLLGSVVDTQFKSCDKGGGTFDMYTVKPAHFGDTPVPKLTHNFISLEVVHFHKINQGGTYYCQKGVIHESRATPLAVTIMKKTNQSNQWARILASYGQTPEHAMARKPQQSLLDALFADALRALPKEANAVIEQLTLAL